MPKPSKLRGPVRRPSIPARRDASEPAFCAILSEELRRVFTEAGYETDTHWSAVEGINKALEYRASHPESLRPADEIEDLEELRVRLDDVLDSLHSLSNLTRRRIQALGVNPDFLRGPLSSLKVVIDRMRKALPADKSAAGRPSYDERHTPLLAAIAMIWFEHYPNDQGVLRDGQYADKDAGTPEYSGKFLDFAVNVLQAIGVHMGSRGAVGKLLHKSYKSGLPGIARRPSLQIRVREQVKKKISGVFP
jgi:hypothetical protein